MTSSRATRVFLDASVLFAGCHSPAGGSAIILEACTAGLLEGITSVLVLSETRKAIAAKSSKAAMTRLERFSANLDLEIVGVPTSQELFRFADQIHTGDCHVLASAFAARCDVLLSLDRKHFFTPTLQKANLLFRILTPGEFLNMLSGKSATEK